VSDRPPAKQQLGLPEGLRTAIERTLAATAGPATETRERAGELLDEVARRGRETAETLGRRGQDARDASAAIANRVVEAVRDLRLASGDEVQSLERQLDELRERLAGLERRISGANREAED
jgi:polyhydroxyalkanoate synthesis regulator phasin